MRPKVIIFGDSITEESFGEADVVLRGYSGYNTRWARKVVERAFEGLVAPLAVTVFFGANDACLPDRSSAFQHVPLPSTSSISMPLSPSQGNYVPKRWPNTLVILITPPPIDEDGRLRHPYGENPSGLPERTNEAAGAYAKSCVSVAMELNTPVVDLWSKMQEILGWEKAFLRDGLHLTPDGNKIVFENLVEIIRHHGVSPEILPADLPLLTQIDPHDPLNPLTTRATRHADG
ncbi:unnamed protein product [Spirodela intermedia]|uniref:Uncharacterized protein n=1 Tax=Spirodela intermedia TaxID=51605 RepID=A0A7I8J718_SPIIN|nr:unnamed protein product [Spirodela intermedia]CAA6665820.1 unnamed protein product [Spirodela intermedia]